MFFIFLYFYIFTFYGETSQEVLVIVKEAEKLILEDGLYKDAIVKLEGAIEKEPDYAPAYLNMGRAYHFQEDYKTAIKYYKQAIECDSEYGEAYYNIGSCYASMKSPDNAAKWLIKAKDVFYNKNELNRYKKNSWKTYRLYLRK